IQAEASVVVVGLPGLIRSLHQEIGMACVVANHKEYLTLVAVVRPDQVDEVEPGDGGSGNGPGGGHCPVSAVDKLCSRIGQTGWLCLRKNDRRIDRRYFAGPVATVIAHSVDVQPIAFGVRCDFKKNSLADIHADIGGKSLDARIARAANLPVRISWKLVFAGDRVRTGLRLAGDRKACKCDRKVSQPKAGPV